MPTRTRRRDLWCNTCQRWTSEELTCEGHEPEPGRGGPHDTTMGATISCDGSCQEWVPLDERDNPSCSRCGETYQCDECGYEINANLDCQRFVDGNGECPTTNPPKAQPAIPNPLGISPHQRGTAVTNRDPIIEITVTRSAGADGALLVMIDTHEDPGQPSRPLRILLNDEPVFHDVPFDGSVENMRDAGAVKLEVRADQVAYQDDAVTADS